jgi:hypothetical protein
MDALFGRLPGQKERHLATAGIIQRVRIISVFDSAAPVNLSTALVAEHPTSTLLVPRRTAALPYLQTHGERADVVFAVSASPTHDRCAAYYTTDDDARPGVPFQLDGTAFVHRYYCSIPGTIALHVTAAALTPLHEFQHAVSSYTNGSIIDLYVGNISPALNCKVGRPIPAVFGTYAGTTYNADPSRDGLGYDASWRSYHCELHDPAVPAVMDNYWRASPPELCENDRITRAFLADRIMAKLGRP